MDLRSIQEHGLTQVGQSFRIAVQGSVVLRTVTLETASLRGCQASSMLHP